MSYRDKRLGFELNKIKRAILTHGEHFIATGIELNEFGEPEDTETEYGFNGIWSTTNSYTTKSSSDSSTVKRKQSPYIMSLISDGTRALKQGFSITHSDRVYEIIDLNDVHGLGLVYFISLEEKL